MDIRIISPNKLARARIIKAIEDHPLFVFGDLKHYSRDELINTYVELYYPQTSE